MDGLRALACLTVIAYHLPVGLQPGGFVGVDVSFVLSGYPVTGLILREWHSTGAVRLGRFYARRLLRLAPALALACVALIAWIFVTRPAKMSQMLRQSAGAVLWLTNRRVQVIGDLTPGTFYLAHTWSLALEAQFYLAWPLALCALLGQRLSKYRLLDIVGAAAVSSALYRACSTARGFSQGDAAAFRYPAGQRANHGDIRSCRSRSGTRSRRPTASLDRVGVVVDAVPQFEVFPPN